MENHRLGFKASSAMNLGKSQSWPDPRVPMVSRVTSAASQRHKRLGGVPQLLLMGSHLEEGSQT